MTGWVLLIYICYGWTNCGEHQAITSATFASQAACELAAEHAKKAFSGITLTVYHICDPQ